MSQSIRGESRVHRLNLSKLRYDSAFWGQSFVAELTRISAHGEKKLKLRRASMARPPSAVPRLENGHSNTENGHTETNGAENGTNGT